MIQESGKIKTKMLADLMSDKSYSVDCLSHSEFDMTDGQKCMNNVLKPLYKGTDSSSHLSKALSFDTISVRVKFQHMSIVEIKSCKAYDKIVERMDFIQRLNPCSTINKI